MRYPLTLSLFFIACGGGSQPGHVAPDAAPSSCAYAFDCGLGEFCTDGTCDVVTSCSTNDQCGPGAYCTPEGACAWNTVGSVCQSDSDCGGHSCEFGFCGCEGEQFTAESIQPNIMIAMDRSTSMLFNIDKPGETSKPDRWDSAYPAMSAVVEAYQDQARFGLAAFPLDGSVDCLASESAIVPHASGNAQQVIAAINSNAPNDANGTPIRAMMENIRAGKIFTPDPTRDNYVLLFTDGVPEYCRGNLTQQQDENKIVNIAKQLHDRDVSVKTFAIGFSSDIDAGFLDRVADAGGTGQSYSALNEATLLTALNDIMAETVSCEFKIDPNINPAQLVVALGDSPVDADENNGWSVNGSRLKLNGASCDALKTNIDKPLTVVTGCTTVID